MAINSTSNEEFPVKTLEDQQKSMCCIYYMISKVIFLGHCVKVKYSYQNKMEGVIWIATVVFTYLDQGINRERVRNS